jgi:XTP/dITP diphosphohydrolase
MRTLIFATTNQGKLLELRDLVGARFELRSAADFVGVPEVEETEVTFEGNARLKALAWARMTGQLALADDSGLCVDALGGRPGVQSARYADTEAARIERLLRELSGVPAEQRTARFECVLVLATPGGAVEVSRGTCEGFIAPVPRGAHGFGYDPVFLLADGRTMAELTREAKSAVSHRGEAFRRMAETLSAYAKE